MSLTFVLAVNNEELFRNCFLRSPDLDLGVDIVVQKGFSSAALAYNSGIQRAKNDTVVLVHQDVYLPEGWMGRVQRTIELITLQDPNWGVLGVWGVQKDGGRAGYVYWQAPYGDHFEGGIEVATLDELLLIVRRSSGLLFDDALGGFHMYGADICLEARRRGMKCYAISALCIHNATGYKVLPMQFWNAYMFMRRKWKKYLPLKTTCIEITRWCWPMIRWNSVSWAQIAFGRKTKYQRNADPSLLYERLVRSRIIFPLI